MVGAFQNFNKRERWVKKTKLETLEMRKDEVKLILE